MSEPATESETPGTEPAASADVSSGTATAETATAETAASAPQAGEKTEKAHVSFEQATYEEQPGLIAEFLEFLVESKAWWLAPIILVLLLVGLLIVLSGSVVAPFIYPIF